MTANPRTRRTRVLRTAELGSLLRTIATNSSDPVRTRFPRWTHDFRELTCEQTVYLLLIGGVHSKAGAVQLMFANQNARRFAFQSDHKAVLAVCPMAGITNYLIQNQTRLCRSEGSA